jgi:hypothetical protein
MIATYTVSEGQRIALWDKQGRREIIDGPRRIRLWGGRRVEPLQPFVAGPTQYLVVQYHDGSVEHQRGPCVVWKDPVTHASIEVSDAIMLDANEALVVYRQIEDDGRVQRRVVRGPELFVPEAREWLHEFRWHGANPGNPNKKIPSALRFTKLRVIPDQMYFDVEGVRTSDDALLVVKLMVFYELIEVDVMLDQTHDVIADFINAVTADVIDFASGRTFEEFKTQTDRLNVREAYPQLSHRAGRIGYRINKVVYRGYEATPKLQSMHDAAIETRTRLKLESETETQAQALADLKLAREQERARRKQEMEQADAEHQVRIKRAGHDEALRQQSAEQDAELRHQKAKHEQSLAGKRQRGEIRLAQRQAAYEQRVSFLKSVQGMQVDLTRYLVAKHERPDKRIRIDGNGGSRVHLHGSTA